MNNIGHKFSPHVKRNTDLYLNNISEADFIDLYRLDKHGFTEFAERIRNHPAVYRRTNGGLTAETQLLVALRYYATGNSIVSLMDTANLHLSKGSVYYAIKNISLALSSLIAEDCLYPFDTTNISGIKQGFVEYGGFPACMGAIDGSQIKIKPPPQNENVYVGRKTDGHYLNIQVVCDVNLKFLDAVVKWPGSVNDTTIWSMCGLKPLLETYLARQPDSYNR